MESYYLPRWKVFVILLSNTESHDGGLMKNDKEQIDKNEAIAALNAIEKMKNASLKRSISPRWYSAVLAILAGSLVFLSVVNLREYQVLVILLMGGVITYQAQKSGVSAKALQMKHLLVAIIILIPLYFLLVVIGQYLIPLFGGLLAPLFAGGLLTILVYILSMYERQKYMSAMNSEDK